MTIQLVTPPPYPIDKFPQLRLIWPEPYASQAAEATTEDWGTGEVFLIMSGGQVVGQTGVFFEPDVEDVAFLRWTGIVPYMRRKGIAEYAVSLLASMMARYTKRDQLIELLPDNEYGTKQRLFFDRLGFVPTQVSRHEEHDWDDIVLGLDLNKYRTAHA